jgi:hypothetical protein
MSLASMLDDRPLAQAPPAGSSTKSLREAPDVVRPPPTAPSSRAADAKTATKESLPSAMPSGQQLSELTQDLDAERDQEQLR